MLNSRQRRKQEALIHNLRRSEQQAVFRRKCTLKRSSAIVTNIETNQVVFNGKENPNIYPWSKGFKGINAAKRFVRKSGQLSFNA